MKLRQWQDLVTLHRLHEDQTALANSADADTDTSLAAAIVAVPLRSWLNVE
jgi:hypothetical protein